MSHRKNPPYLVSSIELGAEDFLRHGLRSHDGEPIDLTSGELEVLVILIKSAAKLLTREQNFAETRGPDSDSFDRAVAVQISRIRRQSRAS